LEYSSFKEQDISWINNSSRPYWVEPPITEAYDPFFEQSRAYYLWEDGYLEAEKHGQSIMLLWLLNTLVALYWRDICLKNRNYSFGWHTGYPTDFTTEGYLYHFTIVPLSMCILEWVLFSWWMGTP